MTSVPDPHPLPDGAPPDWPSWDGVIPIWEGGINECIAGLEPLPAPSERWGDELDNLARTWVAKHDDVDSYWTGYSAARNRFLWAAELAWIDAIIELQETTKKRPPQRGFHLYRLWGPDRRLVYIGVSRCRLKAHRKRWDSRVWTYATWEEHVSVPAMLDAEREAIIDEAPPLNVTGVE